VFDFDIEVCEKCKRPVKIIAFLEGSVTIEKVLSYLKEKVVSNNSATLAFPFLAMA
jgi:hypothetical protein